MQVMHICVSQCKRLDTIDRLKVPKVDKECFALKNGNAARKQNNFFMCKGVNDIVLLSASTTCERMTYIYFLLEYEVCTVPALSPVRVNILHNSLYKAALPVTSLL